ncbi:MAG: hypothetical protein HOP16_11870 [Acidobacteria bacterium]|nr:hypothetical protein [Acidobacteriota bacterium]
MRSDFVLPDIGPTDHADIEVAHWHVADKEFVHLDADLVDISLEKAIFTIKSDREGYVLQRCVPRELVRPDQVLATYFDELAELERELLLLRHERRPHLLDSAGPKVVSGRTHKTAPTTKRSERISRLKEVEIERLTNGRPANFMSSTTVEFLSKGIRDSLREKRLLNAQVSPLILFELVRLLEANPAFTAYYEDGSIHYYDQVNLAVGVDLGKGLKAPVIKDAAKLSADELHRATMDSAMAYLENRLSLEDFSGGTFTVSDLSADAVLRFHPLVSEFQSCILGVGGDKGLPGFPMTLTLGFDHRVLSGREVAAFLNALKGKLLSYDTTSKGTTEAAVDTTGPVVEQDLSCGRCCISLRALYGDYRRDAVMHVVLQEDGEIGYLCYRCVMGN